MGAECVVSSVLEFTAISDVAGLALWRLCLRLALTRWRAGASWSSTCAGCRGWRSLARAPDLPAGPLALRVAEPVLAWLVFTVAPFDNAFLAVPFRA